ncbi:hypothetical protein [Rhizobium vallis]|uniref:hypothetical protein n=1 Tax=Rhizobium vallis TaxID=634290 RepID=UPI0013DFB3FA|nr:hypothetical protein [Rhizobium vallis]
MAKQVIEYAGVPVRIVIPDKGFLKFIALAKHGVKSRVPMELLPSGQLSQLS